MMHSNSAKNNNQHKKWRRRSFRRRAAFLLLIPIVGALSYLDNGNRSTATGDRNRSHTLPADIEKYHDRKFRVIHSIDGDTFDINIPDRTYSRTRIRLLGVDTPEIQRDRHGKIIGYDHFAKEAADYTKRLTHGKYVTLELITGKTRDRTRGKRLLAYVYLENGKMLNRELVRNGFGYSDSRSPHKYLNEFKELMRKARKNSIGLWKNR